MSVSECVCVKGFYEHSAIYCRQQLSYQRSVIFNQARRFGSAWVTTFHSEVEQGDEGGKHGAGNGNGRSASLLRGNVGAVGIAVTGEVDLLGLPSEVG